MKNIPKICIVEIDFLFPKMVFIHLTFLHPQNNYVKVTRTDDPQNVLTNLSNIYTFPQDNKKKCLCYVKSFGILLK